MHMERERVQRRRWRAFHYASISAHCSQNNTNWYPSTLTAHLLLAFHKQGKLEAQRFVCVCVETSKQGEKLSWPLRLSIFEKERKHLLSSLVISNVNNFPFLCSSFSFAPHTPWLLNPHSETSVISESDLLHHDSPHCYYPLPPSLPFFLCVCCWGDTYFPPR